MSRYIRFGYVLPRLIGAVLLLFVLQFTAGYLLRTSVIQAGQSATGAKVELTEASVSLLNAHASIEGLQVANPKRPMENLLEADSIDLDFELDSLLHRKAVAELGSVKGIRFNTPRSKSGILLDKEGEPTEIAAPEWLTGSAEKLANAWIDDLSSKLTTDIAGEFQSVRLAEEMADRWPERYESLKESAKQLRQEAEQLKADFYEARSNPLRNAELLRSLPQRITSLKGQLEELHQAMNELPGQLAAEKAQVAEARRHDEALLARRFQTNQLNSESFTSYLLGEQITEPLSELIAWIRWSREMMPTGKANSRAVERSRGTDVRFQGVKARPDLLVRKLDIEGSTILASQPVSMYGLISNFTTQPSMHSEPLTIEMTTAGNLPLKIEASLDRTGSIAIDEITVDCHTLSTPAMTLGSSKSIAIDMEPTTASLSISLRIEGEKLSGELQLVQKDVRMTPTLAGNSRMKEAIESSLVAGIGHMPSAATRVSLSGTLDNPKAKVWSSLGTSVAKSLNNVVRELAASESQRLITDARHRVDGKLTSMDQNLGQLQQALGTELNGPQEVLNLLNAAPGGRGTLSFEQIGKQLPGASSIFR